MKLIDFFDPKRLHNIKKSEQEESYKKEEKNIRRKKRRNTSKNNPDYFIERDPLLVEAVVFGGEGQFEKFFFREKRKHQISDNKEQATDDNPKYRQCLGRKNRQLEKSNTHYQNTQSTPPCSGHFRE